ncbi:DNA polymerase III subunit alpha [Alicyclobacillus ferrooxydans]|uniref:DNA polymerase III subunit alpha n=1 Tax=Alicyclobacillus ferrooxydans TaxID=471514 RepID=UPI001FDEE0DB|nr:DNA polymerase III subunit alpha [Alicyclobacillus ferrooxydans]
MTEFVHLHVHTEYSLRESTLRLSDAVHLAVESGMTSLAITDSNALYGAIPFYNAAKAAGIKPIIGAQLHVGQASVLDSPQPGLVSRSALDTAVFLAEDFRGYQSLVRLVSQAQARVRQPAVTFEELAANATGLIALIGGGESLSLQRFSGGTPDEAATWLKLWLEYWPHTHLFADVQDHGLVRERKGLPAFVRWAREHHVPLVATNDVHYADERDADIQRILAQMDNQGASQALEGDRYGLVTQEEMLHRFSKLPEAAENTLVIAERCNFELPETRPLLPKYPTQDGEPAPVVLRRAAVEGVRRRYGGVEGEVRERLDYELSVIEQMGFSDYFLVVADFIRYAHKNGISTGPGRGSAAGSLVAYALRITDVDPLKYKLLFERFLNPERVSWPDIDTDFEYERRGEVIQYVLERYGRDYVAQIGTFGTLAARAALRDSGRVLQTPPKVVDSLARQIPSMPGITLAKALEEVPGLKAQIESSTEARTLWETASQLEGLPRHTSTHAAGVVISPIPIQDLSPVQPGGDGIPVTQYPMEVIERLGLIKMDFLGLRTLTFLDRCIASIEAHTGKRLDWRNVPMDDSKTFQMLSRGETEGCFQLESAGMRRVLRDLKPSHFEDIVAVNALYRPGPMDNIPAFIASKHGRTPIHYPHADLAPILKDTYGVIVYQEQIMQIAYLMAGFSLGQADLLRRAVGKKKREVLDQERERFVTGCIGKGYDEEVANHVYDLIVRFADYGFPLSHAAAYAVLAFRTAYLRANFFAHFTAALLTMTAGDENKVKTYTRDAKAHRIDVLPPSILHSQSDFTVTSDGNIRTGLLSVKNVGRGAVEAILTARQESDFDSLVDFLQRVNNRICNRRAVEALLQAGALDDFIPTNAAPTVRLQILEEAYQTAEEGRQSKGLGLVFAEDSSAKENVLYIRYDARRGPENQLQQVKQILVNYPGEIRVALYNQANRSLRVLEEKWSVSVRPELISLLEETVGIGNAKLGQMPERRRTSRSQ